MHVSLNELMLACQKAGRGAGAAEGAAEDLGNAAVWLALRGLPSVEAVYHAVAAVDDGASVYGGITVAEGSITWSPGGGRKVLSAALIGGAAADLSCRFVRDRNHVVCLRDVDVPLLQLAHLSARTSDTGGIRVRWSDEVSRVEFRLMGRGLQAIAERGTPMNSGRFKFEVFRDDSAMAGAGDHGRAIPEDRDVFLTGLEVDDTVWQRLKTYSDRILVEPTARSRVLGAGAGLNDND